VKTYTSVDNIIRRAEENNLRAGMAAARSSVLSVAEIAVGLKKMIAGKLRWLERCPQSDLALRRHELAVLVHAYDRVLGRGAHAGPPG